MWSNTPSRTRVPGTCITLWWVKRSPGTTSTKPTSARPEPLNRPSRRVPVAIGHSEAVLVETERPVTPEAARALWREFPGLEVVDDLKNDSASKRYPMPLDCAGSDTTYVGRIRQDLDNPNGLAFWVVSDNLRKGAASNAVQIAEELIKRGLVKKR